MSDMVVVLRQGMASVAQAARAARGEIDALARKTSAFALAAKSQLADLSANLSGFGRGLGGQLGKFVGMGSRVVQLGAQSGGLRGFMAGPGGMMIAGAAVAGAIAAWRGVIQRYREEAQAAGEQLRQFRDAVRNATQAAQQFATGALGTGELLAKAEAAFGEGALDTAERIAAKTGVSLEQALQAIAAAASTLETRGDAEQVATAAAAAAATGQTTVEQAVSAIARARTQQQPGAWPLVLSATQAVSVGPAVFGSETSPPVPLPATGGLAPSTGPAAARTSAPEELAPSTGPAAAARTSDPEELAVLAVAESLGGGPEAESAAREIVARSKTTRAGRALRGVRGAQTQTQRLQTEVFLRGDTEMALRKEAAEKALLVRDPETYARKQVYDETMRQIEALKAANEQLPLLIRAWDKLVGVVTNTQQEFEVLEKTLNRLHGSAQILGGAGRL